jgi:CarD family transcriptional regulator
MSCSRNWNANDFLFLFSLNCPVYKNMLNYRPIAVFLVNCLSAGVLMLIMNGVKKTEFASGDMAVYPSHGVGKIETIKMQSVGGVDQSFYVLKIIENGMTIMIPTATSKNVGLRPIISKNEARKVVAILKQRDVKMNSQTWNRRYRDYMEKIKTGSLYEVAVVLRDLLLLKEDKDLSYGERKMMDTAKNLLIRELSLARQMDVSKVEQQIEGFFAA